MEYGSFWSRLHQKIKWIDPFTYSDIVLKKINPGDSWSVKFIVELLTAFIAAFVLYTVVGLIMGTGMPLVIVVSGSMEPTLYRGDVVLLQGVSIADDLKVQEISIDRDLEGLSFWDFGTVNYFPDSTAPPLGTHLCEQRQGRGVYSVEIGGKEIRLEKDGDIIVYFSKFPGRISEPIIHRAVLKIHAKDGDYFLTKGDSKYNSLFDQDCGRVVLGIPECSCISVYPIKLEEIQGKAIGSIPLIGYAKLFLIDDISQFLLGCPKTTACPNGCCFP